MQATQASSHPWPGHPAVQDPASGDLAVLTVATSWAWGRTMRQYVAVTAPRSCRWSRLSLHYQGHCSVGTASPGVPHPVGGPGMQPLKGRGSCAQGTSPGCAATTLSPARPPPQMRPHAPQQRWGPQVPCLGTHLPWMPHRGPATVAFRVWVPHLARRWPRVACGDSSRVTAEACSSLGTCLCPLSTVHSSVGGRWAALTQCRWAFVDGFRVDAVCSGFSQQLGVAVLRRTVTVTLSSSRAVFPSGCPVRRQQRCPEVAGGDCTSAC